MTVSAQSYYLEIIPQLKEINYQKKHNTPKALNEYLIRLSENLTKEGFLQNRFDGLRKKNDSVFEVSLHLGSQTKWAEIYIPEVLKTLKSQEFRTNEVYLPFQEISAFLKKTETQIEQEGYALSQINLTDLKLKGDTLQAILKATIAKKRRFDDLIVMGYDRFHQGHLKELKRRYRKLPFSQDGIKELYEDVQKYTFVIQTRPPEVLFLQDSTQVFLYLEKNKASSFDGYVGLNSDRESGSLLTGYLDLNLINALNSGEEFHLYWKNDGKEQQTFNSSIELPYVFNSPFALKGGLNIFKQDTLFQTTRTEVDLGYYHRYNQRIYIGYSSMSSNYLSNSSSLNINDYDSYFSTITLDYFQPNRSDVFFPYKHKATLKIGVGSRSSASEKASQWQFQFKGHNNFYLNAKNSINLAFEGFYLNSPTYLTNELYRFGGIHSIRGFAENSLQASFLSGLMIEYRYVLAPNMYIHNLLDYAYYQDKATQYNQKLLGLGFGIGILTGNGLFNLVYANGSSDNQEIKLSNSVVHLSFRTRF